jgi:uncharacterized protein (TIGR00106 family)
VQISQICVRYEQCRPAEQAAPNGGSVRRTRVECRLRRPSGVVAYATMTSMIAAFSITPLGGAGSVGAPVAEAVRLVRQSGLPNQTNAMFTNVEGEWDEVMNLIKACVMKVSETAPRVSLVIKIDHYPGVTNALRHKVESVERRLAAP